MNLRHVAGILDDADGAIAKLRLEVFFPEIGRLHDVGVAIDDDRIGSTHRLGM
jgi:hypothetical protein